MAKIIDVTPQPQQNNQQQDDYSQTAPARAGTAAAAPPVQNMTPVSSPITPDQYLRPPNMPAFSLAPNQAPDPAVVGPVDDRASPFSQWLTSPAFTYQSNAEQAKQNSYAPLTQAPGMMDHLINFFSRQDPSKPNMDQREAAAAFYARPEVQNVVQGNKAMFDAAAADPVGMHAKLEPLIHAAQNAPIASANGKPVDDQAGLAAHVQRTGMHENVIHPFHEQHKYTEEEFVNATRGINWEQLQQLQGLQHYLTPQQQAFGSLMDDQRQQVNAAQTAYDNAVKAGLAPGKIEDARKAVSAAGAELTKLKREGAFPSIAPMQSSNIEQSPDR